MNFPIAGIITSIQSGIPLAKSIIGFFKKKKKTDVDKLDLNALKDKVKELESKEDKKPIEKLIDFAIQAGTVFLVIWVAKQLGVTYKDIMTLWGIIGG